MAVQWESKPGYWDKATTALNKWIKDADQLQNTNGHYAEQKNLRKKQNRMKNNPSHGYSHFQLKFSK